MKVSDSILYSQYTKVQVKLERKRNGVSSGEKQQAGHLET